MSIYSIGEALIDFMPQGDVFLPAVGGAPANVAACVAKLGGRSHFIGKVGDDIFGKKIIKELGAAGVGVRHITTTDIACTALAFVALQPSGEREFSFFRKPSADMFLDEADIDGINFSAEDTLHFCSVDLIDMPVKQATIKAIHNCRSAGGTISFDPNVRPALWKDPAAYRKVILEFITKADIVKLAEDECDFIFGDASACEIAARLLQTARQVIITRGANGSRLYTKDGVIDCPPFKVRCIDTTGAGDTFIGTYLRYYKEPAEVALTKASAAAAIVCTKKGVLPALPSETELDNFIEGAK